VTATPRKGRAYRLTGMVRKMWQVPHPLYKCPTHVVGIYIGRMAGTRVWHGFEIRVKGRERGVIFMPQADLDRLGVEDLGPAGKLRQRGAADVDHA
jgi:hypothetical protein